MIFVGLRCYICTWFLLFSAIVEISSVYSVMVLGSHWIIILERFYFICFHIDTSINVFKIFRLSPFLRWSNWSEAFLAKIFMKFISFWNRLILRSWRCRFCFGIQHTGFGRYDCWFFKIRLCNNWFGFRLSRLFFLYLEWVIILKFINKLFLYPNFLSIV